MRSGRFLAMAAAAMLTAAPAMAAPVSPTVSSINPAASLSVANTLRAGSKTEHDSQLAFIVIFFIVVVVGVGTAGAAGAFSNSK